MAGDLQVPGELSLTDKQKTTVLELFKADPGVGVVRAFRDAGIGGTRGQIHRCAAEIAEEIQEARGQRVGDVEAKVWEVAQDTDHPRWEPAARMLLKAYAPQFRDHATVEHTGEVGNPDVAAAIDRFTQAVTSAAVRAAAGGGEDEAPQRALPAGEG